MRTEVIEKLKQAVEEGGNRLGPAGAKALELAVKSGFPAELIEFYRYHDPQSVAVQLSPDEPDLPELLLYSLPTALEDTFYTPPGSALFPLGYVTFAGTGCGDVYCLDTNRTTPDGGHPVILFALETIHEDTDPAYIEKSRLVVAASLEDFLEQALEGSLQDTPRYPERPGSRR